MSSNNRLVLPSELFVWYPSKKKDKRATVFIVPVEKASKRYDTVKRWAEVTCVIPCLPQRGFQIGWVISRSQTDNKLIEIQIPDVWDVQISMDQFFWILKQLNSQRVFFDEALLVYDWNNLHIAEGKEIEYTNYTYDLVEKKDQQRLEKQKASWKKYLKIPYDFIKNSPIEQIKGFKFKISRTEGILISRTPERYFSGWEYKYTLKTNKWKLETISVSQRDSVSVKGVSIDPNTPEDILDLRYTQLQENDYEKLYKYVVREEVEI